MRSIVLRYADPQSFALALRDGDLELPLPAGEVVRDGEWVLAVFEIGDLQQATAAAARAVHQPAPQHAVLTFEQRDWERLQGFVRAPARKKAPVAGGSGAIPADRPTQPSLGVGGTPPSSDRPSRPGSSQRAGGSGSSKRRAPDATTPSAPQGARVLLVDDERDIRDVVGAMLDAVGLKVEAATSSEEALERLRAAAYDLLLLDWNLPGMTGLELCRLIRKDARLATLPVLFLTAHAAPQDVVDAFASGADDYVVKPFRAPELGARVFGLLRRARMTAVAKS
ncbi:MAG: response regulator transcription factor [Polyangiaceae bacterium]